MDLFINYFSLRVDFMISSSQIDRSKQSGLRFMTLMGCRLFLFLMGSVTMIVFDFRQRLSFFDLFKRSVIISTKTHWRLNDGGLKQIRLINFENVRMVTHLI